MVRLNKQSVYFFGEIEWLHADALATPILQLVLDYSLSTIQINEAPFGKWNFFKFEAETHLHLI
jgi:hypothetical protein